MDGRFLSFQPVKPKEDHDFLSYYSIYNLRLYPYQHITTNAPVNVPVACGTLCLIQRPMPGMLFGVSVASEHGGGICICASCILATLSFMTSILSGSQTAS